MNLSHVKGFPPLLIQSIATNCNFSPSTLHFLENPARLSFAYICSIAYLCSFKVKLKNLLPWKIKWNCADYTWCGLRLKGFVEQYSLWSSERKLHQCRSAQSHDLLLFSSSFASVAHSKAWLALPSLARLALKLAFGLTYQEKVASLAKVTT